MKEKSLKRYQDLLNIGLVGQRRHVRRVDCDIKYMDPEHVVMVFVQHQTPTMLEIEEWDGDTKRQPFNHIREPDKPADPRTVHIGRDYLKKVVDCMEPGSDIMLTYDTDYPLRMDGRLDGETSAIAWIAPRIENQ